MSLEFLITSLVVVLLPGTGVLYTLAIGIGRGFIPSLAAATGCSLGIVPSAAASILGLAAIFHTSAVAYQAVKYLGVIYLLYMARAILRDGGALDVTENQKPVSMAKTALDGMMLNVLNPKLSLFFLAFLPQFIDTQAGNTTLQMTGLAACFMVMTLLVFFVYGACASLARDYVIRRPNVIAWLKRSFAATFGLLGVKLALSDR